MLYLIEGLVIGLYDVISDAVLWCQNMRDDEPDTGIFFDYLGVDPDLLELTPPAPWDIYLYCRYCNPELTYQEFAEFNLLLTRRLDEIDKMGGIVDEVIEWIF